MKFIVFFMAVFLLAGCGSVTTPESHYYRLADVQKEQLAGTDHFNTDVTVSLFKVSGMLNNRNLLYSNESRPNEVMQLHYHLWHDALPKIMTRQFISYLKLSASNAQVSEYRYAAVQGLHVVVSVERMEIQYSSDSRLHVKLNVQVSNSKGSVLLDKDYENSQAYDSSEIYQLVTHYNDILIKTYSQFLEDFVAL
ncbi:MAG: ABC-type transport auxiliary lipoprotein family protein [Gammaproteobacteria bacterium]|nr:ABC-type transport auxiliary lipoprotein family protein [Gammaproteobacteria bacterium]